MPPKKSASTTPAATTETAAPQQPAPATPKAKAAPRAKSATAAAPKPKAAPKPRVPKNVVPDASSAEVDAEAAEADPSKRHFRVQVGSILPQDGSPVVDVANLSAKGGNYISRTPMQAAKKAFTKIAKASGVTGDGSVSYQFTMEESTRGSAKKAFTYIGVSSKLEVPTVISKKDTKTGAPIEITVNRGTTVKAVRLPKAEKPATPAKAPRAPRGKGKGKAAAAPAQEAPAPEPEAAPAADEDVEVPVVEEVQPPAPTPRGKGKGKGKK